MKRNEKVRKSRIRREVGEKERGRREEKEERVDGKGSRDLVTGGLLSKRKMRAENRSISRSGSGLHQPKRQWYGVPCKL